jgi:hypothetical protein
MHVAYAQPKQKKSNNASHHWPMAAVCGMTHQWQVNNQ